MSISNALLATLRCPISGQPLLVRDDAPEYLYTQDGSYRYPLHDGIALLLADYGEALTLDEDA